MPWPATGLQPLAAIREPDARDVLAGLRTHPPVIFAFPPSSTSTSEGGPGHTCSAPELATQIVEAGFHPQLAAALHMLNANLSAARETLRGWQGGRESEEGDEIGQWLCAILARTEGRYEDAQRLYASVAQPSEVSSASDRTVVFFAEGCMGKQESGAELFAKVWGSASEGTSKVSAYIARTARLKQRLQAEGKLDKVARARRRSAIEANQDMLSRLRFSQQQHEQSPGALAAQAMQALEAEEEERHGERSDLDWEMTDLQRVAREELAEIAGWCGRRFGWGTWAEGED
ncbi:hypothetical protein PUNSTDRAFT_143815 [Punctularia strigosozonata HHB-11173 SS5]|uniref:uncharacterized protein n=1 Tax=Punctularia strigosozonata (strain HHB-11173) TaxID=741275 RepID=UPI0004417710|nr:uncharacterized protein PUNSTDRAFT_143815 [Punctularia strigosozonata HHB-11173 SS5]EIN09374.1 hypothetical protein PUNSTDRAFT_143815 [Punctularia strigosozonata HHB-11173 SS5]